MNLAIFFMLHKARHQIKDFKRHIRRKLPLPTPTVILFDHFGVVCSDPLAKWKHDYQLTGLEAAKVDEICKRIDSGQIELDEFYEQLGHITGQSGFEVKVELDGNGQYDRELLEIIRQLRGLKNVRIGLLTNAHRSLHMGLWKDGVHPYFDDVLTSQEVSQVKPKPDPDFFRHAINRLGGAPEKTIFFDDRQANVDGAKATGIKAHLFINAAQCKVDLHKHRVFG